MGESRLGSYVVQHRYRIDSGDRDRFWRVMATLRDHQLDLGVAHFEVWQDVDEPALFIETIGYDSWSHRQMLEGRSVPPAVQEAIDDFGRLVVGGWDGVESRAWDPCDF